MVQMDAFVSRRYCLRKSAFSGSASISFSNASEIFCFIWAAAALVNVIITSLSKSTGLSLSVIIFMIRATSTAVFPAPAAAETRRFLSVVSITVFWASVHLFSIYSPPEISTPIFDYSKKSFLFQLHFRPS